MDYIIKKLWWENAAELSKSTKNIYNDFVKWNNQAVIVSAMRSPEFNTTDKLILLGKEISKEKIDYSLINDIIEQLKYFHLDTLENKLVYSKDKLIELVINEFRFLSESIEYYLSKEKENIVPNSSNDYSIKLKNWDYFSIIWFWEAISCKIFSLVIDTTSTNWVCSTSVDLSNLVKKEELYNKNESEIFDILAIKISNIVEEYVKKWLIPVLSWYIWVFEKWIENTIWRWYSDATAAVCTVWLARKWYNVVLEIQKSVKWLLSADPRLLDNSKDAKLIKKLDYLVAREITWDSWAQAKLLHHQTLRSEVQEAGVKIHLFDPFSSEDGSWIYDKIQIEEDKWIEFIGWRENVIFFSISSWKMFQEWILSKLFSIVKDYFTVDIISASETEITFTFDWVWVLDDTLEELKEKIREWFNLDNWSMEFVEYTKNRSLIFCVWQNLRNNVWLLAKTTWVLWNNNINIIMASQWRLQRAMIFWIDSKDMKKAVNVLHKEFIK